VALEIDKEVQKLINQAEKKQKSDKTEKSILDKLAKTLIEKETIETEEFEK